MDIFEIMAAIICVPLFLWNFFIGNYYFYIPSWWCFPFSFWSNFVMIDLTVLAYLIYYDYNATPNRFKGNTYYYWY